MCDFWGAGAGEGSTSSSISSTCSRLAILTPHSLHPSRGPICSTQFNLFPHTQTQCRKDVDRQAGKIEERMHELEEEAQRRANLAADLQRELEVGGWVVE